MKRKTTTTKRPAAPTKRPKTALAKNDESSLSLGNVEALIVEYEKRGDIWGMLDLHTKGTVAADYVAKAAKRGLAEREGGKRAHGEMMATVLRIERGLGNLCKRIVDHTPKKKRATRSDGEQLPTLADVGISRKESARWQKLAGLPDGVFEDRVKAVIEKCVQAAESAGSSKLSEGKSYESDEYYTPDAYLALVRDVFGGEIDLDPASSAKAQETVRAKVYYTQADKGESGVEWKANRWMGRTFLNPPYSDPEELVAKLLEHLEAGDVPEAIVLVNNTTDTDWAQMLLSNSSAVCFMRGRIHFNYVDPEKPDQLKEAKNTRQGQVFFYLGNEPDCFAAVFGEVGEILRPRSPLHVPERAA